MRCEASFCYRGNAEGVFEVTLTNNLRPIRWVGLSFIYYKYFLVIENIDGVVSILCILHENFLIVYFHIVETIYKNLYEGVIL